MSDDLSGFSLMDLFRSEAETHTATLSAGLLALEEGTTPTALTVEPMMRAAHSLKGAARIVGLEPAVRVAHVMEDCFVAVQEGKRRLLPRHVDTLLRGVDLLSTVAGLPEDAVASWSAQNEPLVETIVADVSAILTDEDIEPEAAVAPRSPARVEPPDPLTAPPSPLPSDDLSGFSLMELFRTEAETHTATLSAGLLALEEGSASTPSTVEPMMRAAHSLKGAARIVGLDAAARIAHVMEDCFVAVQSGQARLDSGHVDTLLRGLDLLSTIAGLPEQQVSAWTLENEALVDATVAEVGSVLAGGAEQGLKVPPRGESSNKIEVATTVAVRGGAAHSSAPPLAEPRPVLSMGENASTSLAPETADRVVKVNAESLTRLMSLAGESLVQSHRLRPFVDSLLSLKAQNSALLTVLQRLIDRPTDPSRSAVGLEGEMLARAKSLAGQCSQSLTEKLDELEEFARRNVDLADRLHHEVLSSRLRPFSDGVRGFPRMVRDVSRNLGKKVQFEVVGENTGVDRDILEKLESPLNHLIRNALDHAIELPEDREAAGKDATGKIRLEARHRAGMLQLSLSDNGRGIDCDRLRVKIVERRLATPEMAKQLTEAELLEFLFLPGFSTKDAVTELSGRGVGLDVVQNMVRAVGGVVRVSTQAGQGTRFTLQLPISMSVIRALLVRIAGEPYAFPLNRIDRILEVGTGEIRVLEGRQHFNMDGQPVGLVEARQVLDLPPVSRPEGMFSVVVASDRSHRYGVVVDEFLGERDLEVRPLDPRLGKVPNLNSASVLEDGWPVLIIDVEDLVRSVDNLLTGRRLRKVGGDEAAREVRGPKRVLVVDDSITVRELERQLLESHGYLVEVAVDGVDGWNTVRSGEYHLVISDVDMPRMDGIEFVTRLKRDEHLRTIPVVIVSYKDREEDRMRGLDAGANAYLTKSSFHDRTFLRTVVDLIGEAGG